MRTIGEYLKNIREQKELSTVQVQKLSKGRISQSYIVQVENNARTPSVAIIEAFADVYEISIHDLVDVMIEKKKTKSPAIALSNRETELIKQFRRLPEDKKIALMTIVFI